MSASNRLAETGRPPFGQFVKSNRRGNCEEWVASIAEHIDIVVTDVDGAPSPLGVAKAMSIVQSRAYLESRARQLLVPFTKEAGAWHLVMLDLGEKARRRDCEFLMCFVFRTTHPSLSITSPYVEVGFALFMPAVKDPVFVLTVETAVGFPR